MGDTSMDKYSKLHRQAFICKLITSDYLRNKCGQLRTDEQRFLLVFELVVEHLATLLDTKCKQKDSKHSTKLRADGNKSFIGCQYYTAVQEYTESIVYAFKSSEELALAYANRSAALFKLKKYADCVTDIDRALNSKYPDGLKAKLYKRKGLCLKSLGSSGAESSFEKALVWLEKMKLGKVEMNKSRTELEKLISVPCTFTKPPANIMQPPLPDLGTSNPEIPCASAAVSIKYTQKFGRHLVATRKIKPGEVLVVEKPYCMGLSCENIYKHCSYCLQVSWALIPCEYCVNVTYCSEACRDAAWDQYHEVECPVLGFVRSFELNEVLEVSLKVVIMATHKGRNINSLRQEVMNIERNKDPRTKGFYDDGKFHSDQYRSIYSLADNVDKKSAEDIVGRSFWVVLTVCLLARDSNMFGKNLALDSFAKNPDVIFIGGLLLKHVQIGFVTMHSFGAARSVNMREHGNALMALCSLFNHSCDPNVLRQWYAGRMVIFAVHPIEQGEQIFETYGPRFIEMLISERQKYFKYWNFNCECIACTKNWPALADLPSCEEQLLTLRNKNEINIALVMTYIYCTHAKKMRTIKSVLNMFDHLSKSIEILFNLVQRPCKELYELIGMLSEFYQSANVIYNYEQASPSMKNKLTSLFYLSLQHKFSQK